MQDKIEKSNRLKICFLITKGNWGGAQKYVYNLATSLPKDIYEIIVIVGNGNELPEKLREAGIRTISLTSLQRNISIANEFKSFIEIFKIIRKEKPDVLHLNSPKASGLGGLAGRMLFVPKIIETVHGFAFNEKRKALDTILITFFSWVTVLLCHKTIVLSRTDEMQAKNMFFVDHSKVTLIRNGVEKIDFLEKGQARKELLEKAGIKDASNVLWLGTVSELHKNKGLEYMLEAVSKLPVPYFLFIVGEGEERKKLEHLISWHNLKDKVILLGFLENPSRYLKAFDIFLLTSIKEGLPYVILEAGLAGLPVIASGVGGIPDIIENNVSGILTTKARGGEVKRAIEYLINNKEMLKTFGKNLEAKIEKEFSLREMVEKTLKLYSN